MIQNGNQPRVGKPVTNSELAQSIRAMLALLEAGVIDRDEIRAWLG
ncbi:MAG: hypothetical protein JO045_04315 [Mycobacterium sp.]|nr:hypothetical protein [Mycobacterium sp.]